MRRKILINSLLLLGVILLIWMGVILFQDRRYNLISVFMVLLACTAFYLTYEKREGSIRRMVLLAVMTALAVAGRFLFAFAPGFKPVAAVVILSAIYMGGEAGFLIGSLAALISNMFYGQGPWTPFQMFAWGSLGWIAGLPVLQPLLRKRIPLAVFGFGAGFYYSAVMDIWTVLSYEGQFVLGRYLLALASALPVTIEYAVSNVVFLMAGLGPVGRKLWRIQIKHGIFEKRGRDYECDKRIGTGS